MAMKMDRVNQILNHKLYKSYLAQNKECEKDRIFCRHNMSHFLDVARIAMLLNEEEQYGLDQEIVYAAALLHDTGRWKQYQDGEDHALVSTRLAGQILNDCGFEKELSDIVSAISTHRDKTVQMERSLNGLLYRADKLSRPCYACEAEHLCDWKGDKKNKTIIY